MKRQAKSVHRRKRRKAPQRSKNTGEEEHSKTSSRSQKVHDLTVADKKKPHMKMKQQRKMVRKWSVEEDAELRSLITHRGEGCWKELLEDSVLIKKRYETIKSGKSLLL